MKSPLCRLVICRRALKKWSEARDFMPWVMFREEYIYTFANVREGLRAQVQHLKAYASTEPLNNPCVDPRFSYVIRGCAPKTTDLNGRWAVPGAGYGESLNVIVKAVLGD